MVDVLAGVGEKGKVVWVGGGSCAGGSVGAMRVLVGLSCIVGVAGGGESWKISAEASPAIFVGEISATVGDGVGGVFTRLIKALPSAPTSPTPSATTTSAIQAVLERARTGGEGGGACTLAHQPDD